jgi:SAM-dependent methyltransferase
MRKCLYRGKLAFFDQAAVPEFWDRRWQSVPGGPAVGLHLGIPAHVRSAMHRWVARGSRCLEAGCGMGNVVYGLRQAGWPCVGLDYAETTVRTLRSLAPDLEIQLGDVRNVPYPDHSFDCYISLGVIEHFAEGYGPILREMDRILRPGGVALISFPSDNVLRRIKRRAGCWPNEAAAQDHGLEFYQFALDPRDVTRDLRRIGYRILATQRYEGVLGVADDAPPPFDRLLLWLYNKRDSRVCSGVRRFLEPFLAGWAGYCTQIVARKPTAPGVQGPPSPDGRQPSR